ncbi:nuclear transport factor 2 family protein [Nakamurella alba]|uniref:nuclear transport factor 2 family protein n=1 Tax=Nakamurella alba TaxID=2665158 RepID=UPI0018A9D623|nr:nuclear transport factor 2 family protein [Nakamurella alba]
MTTDLDTATTPDLRTEHELRRLAERYAVAMDRTDLDELARLFVPDGRLEVRAPGREATMGVFHGPGPDGVGRIALLLGELYESTMHHITGQVVHPDPDGNPDRATGLTYCLAYHIVNDTANGGGRSLETLGVQYEDTFVRVDGRWRFAVRGALRVWSQITDTPRTPLIVDRAATR